MGFCVAGSSSHLVCAIPEHAVAPKQAQSKHPGGNLAHAKLGGGIGGDECVRTQNSPLPQASVPHWISAQYAWGIGNASIVSHFPAEQ